jgi:hypothetical protein
MEPKGEKGKKKQHYRENKDGAGILVPSRVGIKKRKKDKKPGCYLA